MKTAAQIMKGKQFIKTEMDNRISKTESDALWKKAEGKLSEIMGQCGEISKREHTHTDNYIFPAAALYLTIKEEKDEQTAYEVIEKAAMRNSLAFGRMLAKLLKFPGMKSLFVKVWDPMTKKMFGSKSGFQNVFYPKKKGEFRMDVVACPYVKHFTRLGCPELTKIFCANDEHCYGNLPGMEFRRTGTLGTGASCCDFYFKKR